MSHVVRDNVVTSVLLVFYVVRDNVTCVCVCWVTEPAPIRGEWPLQVFQTIFYPRVEAIWVMAPQIVN